MVAFVFFRNSANSATVSRRCSIRLPFVGDHLFVSLSASTDACGVVLTSVPVKRRTQQDAGGRCSTLLDSGGQRRKGGSRFGPGQHYPGCVTPSQYSAASRTQGGGDIGSCHQAQRQMAGNVSRA